MKAQYKLIIILSIILLATLTIIGLYLLTESNRNRSMYSGHGSTLNTTITIDEKLVKYLNITTTGQSGAGQKVTFNGTLHWIAKTQDSSTAIRNIHLIAYTRLDQNATWSQNTYMLYNGLYIKAAINETAVPTDILDYKEIIVPKLNAENLNYPFSFTLAILT